MDQMDRIGRRSVLTCPDCQGIMWEIDEGEFIRYRCHLGHAYAADPMSLALDESIRRALASGLRALEERAVLAQGIAERAGRRGNQKALAESWARKAREFDREAETVRDSLRRFDQLAQFVTDDKKERS